MSKQTEDEVVAMRAAYKYRWIWYAVFFVAGEIFDRTIVPLLLR